MEWEWIQREREVVVEYSIAEVRGEELAGHTLSMFSRGVRRWDGGHTGGHLGTTEVNETTRMRSMRSITGLR